MTLSDFYALWTNMKLKLKKKPSCEILINLLSCIEDRQKCLFENASILSALFLDPRYRVVLHESAKQIAVQHLTRLWKRVQETMMSTSDSMSSVEPATPNDIVLDNEEDEFDTFLSSMEQVTAPQSILQSSDIMLKLQQFDKDENAKKRLPRSENILMNILLAKSREI